MNSNFSHAECNHLRVNDPNLGILRLKITFRVGTLPFVLYLTQIDRPS